MREYKFVSFNRSLQPEPQPVDITEYDCNKKQFIGTYVSRGGEDGGGQFWITHKDDFEVSPGKILSIWEYEDSVNYGYGTTGSGHDTLRRLGAMYKSENGEWMTLRDFEQIKKCEEPKRDYSKYASMVPYYGGGKVTQKKFVKTDERVTLKGKEKVVYIGTRGAKYVKVNGEYVSLKKMTR